MKAELFYLSKDAAKVALIRNLLEKRLGNGVVLLEQDVEYGLNRARMAERYRQLLQATFPPNQKLSLHVAAMDFYFARIYLYVYWPIIYGGYEMEIEGTSVSFERSWATGMVSAYPNKRGLELFFPALAIRDRMVMVPAGQGKLLDIIGASAPETIKRDVHEVNFDDADGLDGELQQVAEQVRQAVRADFTAYINRKKRKPVDMTEAARNLAVSPELLEVCLDEEGNEVADAYQALHCSLEPEAIPQGSWTKLTLCIRNDSSISLQQVNVTMRGPIEILPATLKIDLPAHQEIQSSISIRPSDPGAFPIEIVLVARQHSHLTDMLPSHHIWVQSVPT